MAMAVDALGMIVPDSIERGEDLPRPKVARGRKFRVVCLPALQSAKAELYMAFKASGIRKAELARRLGIPKTTVDRLFDFGNHSRLDQIEAAFAALGKGLSIDVEDAAQPQTSGSASGRSSRSTPGSPSPLPPGCGSPPGRVRFGDGAPRLYY